MGVNVITTLSNIKKVWGDLAGKIKKGKGHCLPKH